MFVGLFWAKRRAVRAYKRRLRREGLPGPLIDELAREYNLRLRDFS